MVINNFMIRKFKSQQTIVFKVSKVDHLQIMTYQGSYANQVWWFTEKYHSLIPMDVQ